MAQHIHSYVKHHFNEAIIIVTAWSGDRNPVGGGGEISTHVQTGPGALPVSYTMGTGSYRRVGKRPGSGVNHTPTSSAEVKERVEL